MIRLIALIIALCCCLALADQQPAPTPKRAVIKFSAVWCGPCRSLQKKMESKEVVGEMSKQKLDFYQVDIDKSPEYVKMYNIGPVPTVIMVQLDHNGDGIELKRFIGDQNKEQVLQWLKE